MTRGMGRGWHGAPTGALSRTCPVCGVGPGFRCLTGRGGYGALIPMDSFHPERRSQRSGTGYDVVCPECGVAPGHKCRRRITTIANKTVTMPDPHPARLALSAGSVEGSSDDGDDCQVVSPLFSLVNRPFACPETRPPRCLNG
jgi:hypothetical protein